MVAGVITGHGSTCICIDRGTLSFRHLPHVNVAGQASSMQPTNQSHGRGRDRSSFSSTRRIDLLYNHEVNHRVRFSISAVEQQSVALRKVGGRVGGWNRLRNARANTCIILLIIDKACRQTSLMMELRTYVRNFFGACYLLQYLARLRSYTWGWLCKTFKVIGMFS